MDIEQHITDLFARGDSRAMDVLYSHFANYLTGVCIRYVPQQEDLHDVLQEAFIKIFTTIGSFKYRGKGSLKAWMTRITVNEALMFLRDKKKMQFMDNDQEPPDIAETPPDTSALTADSVAYAIAQLPDGYRTVFNLYAIEGKSHKEIAKILNIKPDTSASQFHRAKAILARILNATIKNQRSLSERSEGESNKEEGINYNVLRRGKEEKR